MNFAREGVLFIIVAALPAAGMFALAVTRRSWPIWLLALAVTLVASGLRTSSAIQNGRVSAGRGSYSRQRTARLAPHQVDEPAFLHGRALRVSIFMNVFNVHVNRRYPVGGTRALRSVERRGGSSTPPRRARQSRERAGIGLDRVDGTRVLVRQIAGLIARRIHT